MPPELTFDNLSFRVYRGPVLAAEGTARRASFRRDSADASATSVDVLLPASGVHAEARLLAATAHGNVRDRWFVAEGGVRAAQSGQVAVTQRARYDASDGLVRGDAPVTVRGGGFTANGAGFTFDPREETVRLIGGTRVVAGGGRR